MKALITGGTGGIGEPLVRLLAEDGHDVIFTFHRGEAKARAIEADTGSRGVFYDFADRASVDRLTSLIDDEGVSLLVNIPAPAVVRQLVIAAEVDDVLRYLDVGLRGPLALSRAVGRRVATAGGGGAIVNVLTMYVLGLPPEKVAAYVALKSALLGLTRSMAVELARHRVRVNAVSPAMTRTAFLGDLPERFLEVFEEGTPFGRMATAGEVAETIRFLLSPGAAYISGANIPVAGAQAC